MVNGFFANVTTGTDDVKVKINTAPIVEAESNIESNLESNFAATTVPATEAELAEAEPIEAEPAEAEPAEEAPASQWQQQKQVIMAKYGFDSETPAALAEPNANQSKSDTPANIDNPPVISEAPVVSETAPAVAEEASVEELKRQLNSKIREAEVEMSINRARLMQERVEFERAQEELKRHAATLEAKLAANADTCLLYTSPSPRDS